MIIQILKYQMFKKNYVKLLKNAQMIKMIVLVKIFKNILKLKFKKAAVKTLNVLKYLIKS